MEFKSTPGYTENGGYTSKWNIYMNSYWITGCVMLLLLSAVYLLYLGYKRFRLLKKMEAMRYHIARDLHDDIGATLSSISFYTQAVKQKTQAGHITEALKVSDQIGILSREMMENMNDIVWMVSPLNDATDKFFERIDDYGTTLFASKEILFLFYADLALSDIVLDMNFRKEYYLICKEAMNNAAKYASCNTFEILIKRNGQMITTVLKDNGRGFAYNEIKAGNGLLNMKVRTESLGGNLAIESAVGKGTTLSFQFPVTPKW
jgi:signal transduction histidine kinase